MGTSCTPASSSPVNVCVRIYVHMFSMHLILTVYPYVPLKLVLFKGPEYYFCFILFDKK